MFRVSILTVCCAVAMASVKEASMFSYPWLAGIGSAESNLFACSGVLVHKNWVLTAAHCDLKIGGALHLHRHDMYDYAEKGAQVSEIQQIIRHPDYKQDTLENDIALVGFCSNCTIPPAKLPNTTFVKGSSVFLTAGWGKISVIQNKISKRLHQQKVQALDTVVCKDPQHYGSSKVTNAITDSNICIQRDGFGYTCQEDAGTPLFEGNTVYGLSSWSIGCGDAQNPGVYTKIAVFSEWIRKMISSTRISACDTKHRHLQQGFDCTMQTSCGTCAGQSYVNSDGAQKFCYWCGSTSSCVGEDAFSSTAQCPLWSFNKDECSSVTGPTGTSTTGTQATGTKATSVLAEMPTENPTEMATEAPTEIATEQPTEMATEQPTEQPTEMATEKPTEKATEQPTEMATEQPTEMATEQPTEKATEKPTEPAAKGPLVTMGTTTATSTKSTSTEVFAPVDTDAAKCGFNTCSNCAGRRYTDSDGNDAQCYWCGGQNKCITQSAWETNEVCDSQAFVALECPSNGSADACVGFDSCSACVDASYTNVFGAFNRCVWCGNSCLNEARTNSETCNAPVSKCSAIDGPSDSTCAQLNWSVGPGSNVCAASIVAGKCSYTVPHEMANSWCRDKGARMCTADEIKADVATGTGCKLDSERIWTSTKCEGGAHSLAGSSAGLDKYPEKCTPLTETLRVRCCADQPSSSSVAPSTLPKPKTCTDLGWSVAPGSPYVCANSVFRGGVCGSAADYKTAQSSCLAQGARLCTSKELSNDDAKGSGCKLDDKMVWSSSTCTINGVTGQIMQKGSSDSTDTTQCSPVDNRAGVRCCADEPNAKAEFSCEELQWGSTPVVVGQVGRCAKSKINGQCSGNLSFKDAAAFCAATGARVCTSGDLEANVAKLTGCQLDGVRVWTSTSCQDGSGFITRGGTAESSFVQCDPPYSLYPVRCCASSTTIVPGGRGTTVSEGGRGR